VNTITLDEDTHTYRVAGRVRIGVTEVFSGLHLIDVSHFTDYHRNRGHAVHAAVRYWLEGALKWSSVDPAIVGHVRSAIKFIEDAKLVVSRVETPLFSPKHDFCGTADFIGTILGELAVIDWKSGQIGPTTGMQTAAYALALEEEAIGPRPHYRRIGVALDSGGGMPKKKDFKDHRDERRFLAALDLYRTYVWKGERNGTSAPGTEFERTATA
jgi:hypothetical protein